MQILIRPEETRDRAAIYDLTRRAFAPMPFAAGDEQDLVNVLRDVGALTLSLVAEKDGQVIGHIALSPATHESGEGDWFALGPISVEPTHQRRGIGGALIAEAKGWMTSRAARGCILVGDPAYYPRHGFLPAPAHTPAREPPEYFMVLAFGGAIPAGRFRFHEAFYTA